MFKNVYVFLRLFLSPSLFLKKLFMHLRVDAGNCCCSAKESFVQRSRDGLFRVFGGDAFRLISAFEAAACAAGTGSDASRAAVVRVLYSGRCHYDALEAR